MEEDYIVFQRYAPQAEWEQESIMLSLERAKAYKQRCKELHPDKYYCIMKEIEL